MIAKVRVCSRSGWSAAAFCGHRWRTASSPSALRNYTVVSKPAKEFADASGYRKVTDNKDIELAVHAMELDGYRSDGAVLR